MAKSSQHFYPGSARVSRAGDRVLAITNFDVSILNQTNVLFDSANLSLRLARFGVELQTTADDRIIRSNNPY